jgi:hypothetical protein
MEMSPYAGEGLLRAFEQGGHTRCDTGPRFFQSHPKDRPIQSSWGCEGPILTRILTEQITFEIIV